MTKRSSEDWRETLTPEQYRVLREGGTEAPGSGALLHNKADGTYRCAGCGAPLFGSDTKYDSGSGWPSFTAPVEGEAVDEISDRSHGMERVEVRCKACEGHLATSSPTAPGPRACAIASTPPRSTSTRRRPAKRATNRPPAGRRLTTLVVGRGSQ